MAYARISMRHGLLSKARVTLQDQPRPVGRRGASAPSARVHSNDFAHREPAGGKAACPGGDRGGAPGQSATVAATAPRQPSLRIPPARATPLGPPPNPRRVRSVNELGGTPYPRRHMLRLDRALEGRCARHRDAAPLAPPLRPAGANEVGGTRLRRVRLFPPARLLIAAGANDDGCTRLRPFPYRNAREGYNRARRG